MSSYSKLWTQFETQSLAFGLLRKSLYPEYVVRGYENCIWIYTPTADAQKPIPKLIINILPSKDISHSGVIVVAPQQGVPVIEVTGGNKAYAIVEIAEQYLK